ncbi:MAG: hypothetical protein AB1671_17695 [Thermodesulfobacteriota bacterium]
MRRGHGFTIIILAALLLSPASAQPVGTRSLYGLDEVGVLVADLHPDAERRGAERAKLQADVERRLQQAGIHVLTEDQWKAAPGKPLLYLNVGVEPLGSLPVYSVSIRLQLRQPACLARNLILCETAVTWEDVSATRILSVSRLSSLRDEIHAVVDRFIDACRKENARP